MVHDGKLVERPFCYASLPCHGTLACVMKMLSFLGLG
jgi:hypothetical protein